jgi:hypothetical protein
MKRYVIDDLVDIIDESVKKHNTGKAGEYCRWLVGKNKSYAVNEYGVADAANILYTIGRFPSDTEERDAFVKVLQSMQDPETGLFHEPTHPYLHTTAHCSAALELFEAQPLYKCTALEKYTTKEGLYALLESLDWGEAWGASHHGAGILPSLTNTDMVGLEWKDWYFDWMWEHSDPEIGFIVYGEKTAPLYRYMAGGFHYMFNHEAEHRPYRYPEKIIDSALYLMENEERLIKNIGFMEIDVVYSLTRAMRQSPHRFDEARKALEVFAERFFEYLYAVDYENDELFNDLHSLFGTVCCLAELQAALPGKILTTKPLKLVLDRRPFI